MAKKIEVTHVQDQEQEAKKVGRLDAFLVGLFAALTTLAVSLLEWIVSGALDLLSLDYPWWPFAKGFIILIGTMILKGIDRKRHEDPSEDTGLVKL